MVELPFFESLPEAQGRLRNLIAGTDSDAAPTAGVAAATAHDLHRQGYAVSPERPALEAVSLNSTKEDAPENVWNTWQY